MSGQTGAPSAYTTLTVDDEAPKVRLDAFLADHFSDISRARWKKRIDAGFVTVDGAPGRAAQKLTPGAVVVVQAPGRAPVSAAPEAMDLDVVYEDDDVIVVNKPAGLVVHPAAGHPTGTLVNGLLHHVPNLFVADEARPGIVHRLDKDTSGLIVCAKTDAGFRVLGEQFRTRTVDKVYAAFCYGRLLESPLALITGHVRHKTNRLRYTTKVAAPEGSRERNIRRAEADYAQEMYAGGVARIRVVLKTGRTHQIRAQMADIGHPLVGDALYGGAFTSGRIHEGRRRARAGASTDKRSTPKALAFDLPSGERRTFTAPLPDDLALLETALHEVGEE